MKQFKGQTTGTDMHAFGTIQGISSGTASMPTSPVNSAVPWTPYPGYVYPQAGPAHFPGSTNPAARTGHGAIIYAQASGLNAAPMQLVQTATGPMMLSVSYAAAAPPMFMHASGPPPPLGLYQAHPYPMPQPGMVPPAAPFLSFSPQQPPTPFAGYAPGTVFATPAPPPVFAMPPQPHARHAQASTMPADRRHGEAGQGPGGHMPVFGFVPPPFPAGPAHAVTEAAALGPTGAWVSMHAPMPASTTILYPRN
jgi:hypothetical protein